MKVTVAKVNHPKSVVAKENGRRRNRCSRNTINTLSKFSVCAKASEEPCDRVCAALYGPSCCYGLSDKTFTTNLLVRGRQHFNFYNSINEVTYWTSGD
jgi:hypothetical protein